MPIHSDLLAKTFNLRRARTCKNRWAKLKIGGSILRVKQPNFLTLKIQLFHIWERSRQWTMNSEKSCTLQKLTSATRAKLCKGVFYSDYNYRHNIPPKNKDDKIPKNNASNPLDITRQNETAFSLKTQFRCIEMIIQSYAKVASKYWTIAAMKIIML